MTRNFSSLFNDRLINDVVLDIRDFLFMARQPWWA